MNRRSALLALASVAALGACSDAPTAPADLVADRAASSGAGRGQGAVFAISNAAAGNSVVAYARQADGSLSPGVAHPTGGLGTGAGLGSQGAVQLSDDRRWLFAVNAGSDDVSAFRVDGASLALVDRVGAGGDQPVSLTVHGSLLYVVNAGSDAIAGFRVGDDGSLSPIAGSTRPLSAAGAAPAQIAFAADGRLLVVTEKATNTITTYVVGDDGVAGAPQPHASSGITPFGFAVAKRGQIVVSEAFGGAADASAASSYQLSASGALTVVTPSLGTTETAACWVAIAPSGRYAFVANTGSNSVTAYAVAADGTLARIPADGRSAGTGAAPADADVSHDGRFLYVRNGGGGTISAFAIDARGALTALGTVGGLPATGSAGLAAW